MKKIGIMVLIAVANCLGFQSDIIMAKEEPILKAGLLEGGILDGQPYTHGNGESDNFRIPAMVTLNNGWIVTAADARYSSTYDGGGLDTMVCLSNDNGHTWKYSYPLFFPDSDGYDGINATTIIDPSLIQGNDGTIYLIADVNPTGVTTGLNWPKQGTGYVEIDGDYYLALTDSYDNTLYNPSQDIECNYYQYYIDDSRNSDGLFNVLNRMDKTETPWVVDEYYNIYQKSVDKYEPLVTHGQTNNENQKIQENVFYKASSLHVYQTGYIWLASSSDYGKTWNHTILNSQIKHDDESALLVSPGRGLVLDDGTLIFGFYNMGRSSDGPDGTAQASFIYSKDGVTWKRTTDSTEAILENELVQINESTVRMFCRTWSNKQFVTYIDLVKDANGNWLWKELVEQKEAPSLTTCNVTAIKYSKKINGKDLILVSAVGHAASRKNGKIYTFLLNDDSNRSMETVGLYEVNRGQYQYASLTELTNGTVGLLWEGKGPDDDAINFDVFTIDQLLAFSSSSEVLGDINGDHILSIADVVLLKKWLLVMPDVHLINWSNADFDKDETLDVFDLGLMKRALLVKE